MPSLVPTALPRFGGRLHATINLHPVAQMWLYPLPANRVQSFPADLSCPRQDLFREPFVCIGDLILPFVLPSLSHLDNLSYHFDCPSICAHSAIAHSVFDLELRIGLFAVQYERRVPTMRGHSLPLAPPNWCSRLIYPLAPRNHQKGSSAPFQWASTSARPVN